jgi:geranylgeranyl pyrophosphate synthase
VQAGGRRWRPGLVAETIDLLGGDSDYYGPLIAAAEIVHTGSLIVDDVQDASPLRRGVPSAHTVYGIATALTAGTNAYFSIDQAISQTMPDNPLLAGQLRELLLTTLRSAHAGQALDVQGHTEEMNDAVATGEADTVLELVRLTHRLKSGAPVALGMGMAALLCGADDHLFHRLSAFGEAVGTAYQITDDVADVRGVTHEGIVTKEIAEDTRNGKVTMPLAHAIALLPSKRLHRIWDIVCSPASNQQDISELRDTLVGCGALNTCKEEADDLLRRAWTDLEPALPCTPGSKALYETARHVVQDSRIA